MEEAAKLKERLADAAGEASSLLDGRIETGVYVQALRELIKSTEEADVSAIRGLEEEGVAANIVSTLLANRQLIITRFPEEADRLSMFSTLAVYCACLQEGLPDHSRVYMDRVSQVRKLLDAFCGRQTAKFCGS